MITVEKTRDFLSVLSDRREAREELLCIFDGSLEWVKGNSGRILYARIKQGKRTLGLLWIKPEQVKERW